MNALWLQWDWSEPPDPTHWRLLSQVAEREPWAIEHGLLAAKCMGLTARALTLSEGDVKALSLAGFLHDVGKIVLPPAFLHNKTAPLSAAEFTLVQTHPSEGARLARSLNLPHATVIAILLHHERSDGRGYPFGKGGQEIPIEGHIAILGELVSSFLTPRLYRPALSPAQAIARLRVMSGDLLDREVVRAFLSRFPQLFGLHSLSALEGSQRPVPIEALAFGEERQVWQAMTMFLLQLLADAERLLGEGFSCSLARHLDHWCALHDVPLQIQRQQLKSLRPWWQTLGDLLRTCRLLLGLIFNTLSYLLGASFVSDWMQNIRRTLPEPLDTVGLRYGLWVWTEPTDESEVVVKAE